MPLTPIAVKEYLAKINQQGTSAPTATTIKNTYTNTGTYTREAKGWYKLHLPGELTNKTIIPANQTTTSPTLGTQSMLVIGDGSQTNGYILISQADADTIDIISWDATWTQQELKDIIGTDAYIHINILTYNN